MQYPSIRIEGAIISAELISLLDGDTDMRGQKSTDFGLANGTRVKDDIAIRWADAQNYYRIYKQRATLLRQTDPGTTLTRNNWMVPLLGLFGFEIEPQSGLSINNQTYAISHRASNRANTPIYIIGANDPAGLDRKPANATRRMSAHAILQEYLNLSESLYGIVSNGRVLRVLRDSSRLVKQSYLEFDLERIFEDGLYADFAILYRLVHASRFPLRSEATAECLLERYHQDSLDAGARIRDGLSKAVELAILTLANGFLEHPDNQALHHAIATNTLTATQYYQELLRLIYRMLFLMVVEERNLIFPVDAKPAHVKIYANGYAIQRLRTRSEKPYTTSKQHTDLWFGLLATFRLFQSDGNGTSLGIAPLAGALFATSALAHIGQAQISNDTLARAVAALNSYQNPRGGATRVNYGALNVEEFGSVYEGLLEYAPQLTATAHGYTFSFVAGQDRAASGSHYTPDDLVQPLIKHSLDYLIEDCRVKPDPAAALLDLRVADIACGSGHILLAAARRIATALATARTGEEQPSPSAYRSALRDTIRQCIYGVDLNPLAVELCKVALWIEAHEPGKPLNFLDHHIKCGNSIVGFVSLDDVAKGVPDEAFSATPQDNKDIASTLRKANREARKLRDNRQLTFQNTAYNVVEQFQQRIAHIAQLPEGSAAEVSAKAAAYEQLAQSTAMQQMRAIADVPVAQFYLPKTAAHQGEHLTDAAFVRLWNGQHDELHAQLAAARQVATQKRFFHWFLEFPDIVARGGFDCILGNPPYLGGKKLSDRFGNNFCAFVRYSFYPAGLSDLVVYFLRRVSELVSENRFISLITTNSITDGVLREDGLDVVLQNGNEITAVHRSVKWPGVAKLVVSLLVLYSGKFSNQKYIDGRQAKYITTLFEDGVLEDKPSQLKINEGIGFVGSILKGNGFIIDPLTTSLNSVEKYYKSVIWDLTNGDEINTNPLQSPSRKVICLEDWSLEFCEENFPDITEYLRINVLPERKKYDPQKNGETFKLYNQWWLFSRYSVSTYSQIRTNSVAIVCAITSKYLNFSLSDTRKIFTHAVYILKSDRDDVMAILQSTIHEVWARKYSGALGATLRYSPSDCFETFAFPAGIWQQARPELAAIGAQYHEHRRQVMLHLWLGLTDVYNLFHSPRLDEAVQKHYAGRARKDPQGLAIPAEHRAAALAYSAAQALADIQQLRALHVALDTAVLAAYGWSDLDLAHDFYDVDTLPENDRTRYTISPTARRELLSRLLTENHARAAQEARDVTLTTRKTTSKKLRGDTKGDANQSELF